MFGDFQPNIFPYAQKPVCRRLAEPEKISRIQHPEHFRIDDRDHVQPFPDFLHTR
jgi:hypothetical protein